MPTVLRKSSLLFAACLVLATSADINTASAQTKPAPSKAETTQADSVEQNTPDTPDDELEAAAVTLDGNSIQLNSDGGVKLASV